MMVIGLMENSIKENVLILMGKFTKENGKMENLKAKESRLGLMVANMMVCGEMENL